MNVKQERHDEAEIQELAAKFVEANKAKMALPQRPPQQAGQSMNILSFLTTDKSKAKTNNVPVQSTSDSETKNIDEESMKGRFGWTLMGKMHIPYILRSGESYCAVRMVEMKVLNKLLNYLHQDLYNCTNIRSYYITEAEARLLNEINFKHCDYQFGREQFTSRDLIVRLTDANEFYQFLGHCYAKLVNTTEGDNLDRCGFIRINRESVVPYTVYNEQKYVPLFYFEGETDNLKQRADKLEGWDLSYLKFCCKVQGIRNELFAHDSCSVISLNDIKNYFPPGTLFEDYWPKKNLDSQLLINNRNPNQQQIVQWTRQPTAPPISAHPPPSPKPATQAKAANNSHMHNVHVYSNYGIAGGQPPYHAAQPRTASSAVRATYPSAASRHMRPYFSNIGQAPPPLVRANSSTYEFGLYNSQVDINNNPIEPEAQIYEVFLVNDDDEVNPPSPLYQDDSDSDSDFYLENAELPEPFEEKSNIFHFPYPSSDTIHNDMEWEDSSDVVDIEEIPHTSHFENPNFDTIHNNMECEDFPNVIDTEENPDISYYPNLGLDTIHNNMDFENSSDVLYTEMDIKPVELVEQFVSSYDHDMVDQSEFEMSFEEEESFDMEVDSEVDSEVNSEVDSEVDIKPNIRQPGIFDYLASLNLDISLSDDEFIE